VAGQWFSLGSSVSSTNKTDRHDIAEILLKVALNPISTLPFDLSYRYCQYKWTDSELFLKVVLNPYNL
jgi:hypothetical protein